MCCQSDDQQLSDSQQYRHPLVIDHMTKAELIRVSMDLSRLQKEIMTLIWRLTCRISEVMLPETGAAVLLSRGIADTRSNLAVS